MNDLQLLTTKDIANICNCSIYIATLLKKDLLKHYGITPKQITLGLLKKYLKL